MVAKSLLPVYGGTPAVWTICMLFFQIILLVSYGYVGLLGFIKRPIYWRLIHLGLILFSLTTLPIALNPQGVYEHPEWSILYVLITQAGIPLFIIGASAPLLQFAYSQTQWKGASDPYFLYSASNLGSLLSLLIYPWGIEQFIGLGQQFHLWTIGYWIDVILLSYIFIVYHYEPLKAVSREAHAWPILQAVMLWVFLSFVPCSLMMGVTLYITTDVAATPLFWVLPLSLYLLSFILTFTKKPIISHQWVVRNSFFFIIFPTVSFILGQSNIRAWELVLVHLMSFFVLSLLAHGTLFQKRPKPQWLPLFYFCLAIGGVLAGVFNGILAPHWFNAVYEYPLAIVLCVLIIPLDKSVRRGWVPVVVLSILLLHYVIPEYQWFKGISTVKIGAIASLIVLVAFKQTKASLSCSLFILFAFLCSPVLQYSNILLQERNFYGVKQVLDKEGVHVLISQSTVHGLQPIDEKMPISGFRSYYGALQSIIESLQHQYTSLSVTIMGLGAGTMVCQHRATDKVQVIEIDPQMIRLAKDSKLFTFLRDCPAQIKLIKNDGRIALTQLPDESQNLLVLDAFNSDAIPVHLLTLEAFRLYQDKLTKDGVILVNMSNRHIKILPVLNAIGHSLDFMVFFLAHRGDAHLGQLNSEWALLTKNENVAFQLMSQPGWRFAGDEKQSLWTDDYSNIVPLIRW
jgi:spermidine synthase